MSDSDVVPPVNPLNIPAFRRKAQLNRRLRHRKLFLTALDRKKAGIASPLLRHRELKASVPTIPQLKVMLGEPKMEYFPQPQMPFEKRPGNKEAALKKHKKNIKRTLRKIQRIETVAVKKKTKPVGIVTMYLPKIQVAVIKLSKKIEKGDVIVFNRFEQTITSMQIDHIPVNSASKEQEAGVKLDQPVEIGELVYKKE